MSGDEVRQARNQKGWTQARLAQKLQISQGYVSLLESTQRPVSRRLAGRVVSVLGMSPSRLPVSPKPEPLSPDHVPGALSTLGYPGFSHVGHRRKLNPAEVVVRALQSNTVPARVVEALPWLLVRYPDLDWETLLPFAKQHDLQNRLGFVVTVARELAERRGETNAATTLSRWEHALYGSRLAKEDAFGGDALTEAERRWLRTHSSTEAARWNLLTDVSPETLSGF